jgi:hypothetical protein
MTAFGKLLVFCNLTLSLFLMTWALGVWTNRIDFSNAKATAEQSAGEFAKRDEVLKTLGDGLDPAQRNWRDARGKIADQEARQVADWEFYRAELDHNRTRADKKNPCRTVAYADKDNDKLGVRKGQIDLAETGLPKMVNVEVPAGNGLPCLATLDAEVAKNVEAIALEQDKFIKQTNEATALTQKLVGDKGLQQRLLDEKQKRENVLAEQKLVGPQRINAYVEYELIGKRNQQLLLRIAELDKIGVAVRDR